MWLEEWKKGSRFCQQGADRAVFLLGKVQAEWQKVKPDPH